MISGALVLLLKEELVLCGSELRRDTPADVMALPIWCLKTYFSCKIKVPGRLGGRKVGSGERITNPASPELY